MKREESGHCGITFGDRQLTPDARRGPILLDAVFSRFSSPEETETQQ